MSNLGASLHGRGHLSKAEAMFRKAIAKGSAHGKWGLARVFIDRGKTDEAETLLRHAAAQGQTEAATWHFARRTRRDVTRRRNPPPSCSKR
ncbi:tetratricopeptide repeat protein [Pseudarthrobacter sp. O4]|uniref:tetratricopeptide repeat protein n=1 Tax=Pseudarthrobacter sp. O4 TaxID=3418417 RepID=UPI003CFAE159